MKKWVKKYKEVKKLNKDVHNSWGEGHHMQRPFPFKILNFGIWIVITIMATKDEVTKRNFDILS
jgi:hypothetical protein